MLLCVTVAGLAPAVYYFWLSKNDAGWKLAGQANSAGAQDLWSWPWWAIALTVLPLAVPAALAYRLPAPSWQDVAVRIWPAAVLLVYLQPTGTFPYHSFQGLQSPLAVLAVLGVRSVAPRLRPWIAVVLLGVMVIPGTIHKGTVLRHSVQSAGDPYWVFPGEVDALKALDRDPRRGGVLAPTYSSLLVPYRTGREAYVGPFSWTPDWENRATSANALFEGRLTGAAGRRFIVSTHARWLFADCRPLALPALARTVAPRGVTIENTPIRNVALPTQLTEAIEQKQRADQESQRMEFILTKEKQEADRKRIEAKGIADFQTIVAAGISEQLLRWKGIEATEKIAQSPNTKVIIVGAGRDGLPIILDTK